MSLEICVLGSGSSGNATVLRSPWGVILIDAGFGPRATAQRMSGTGLGLKDIAAICLTHLDTDHFNKYWYQTILKQRIRIFCHRSKMKEVVACAEARAWAADPRLKRLGVGPIEELVQAFDGESFEPLSGLKLRPFALEHDTTGSHGFVVESGSVRMGFATDLGRVPEELLENFCGVDILAIESNYDPEMERTSDRPWHLKQRIMGGTGHLSNEQALAAVVGILDRCEARHGARKLPRHIVLLHRSRQCNCPKLLRRLFSRDPRIAAVLTLADQHEPTGWLRCRGEVPLVGEQMVLGLG